MFPQGILMRAWGGYPVDRSKNNNLVESMVEIFNGKERFAIALAPEGTRNKVKRFRSGFYHIAKKVGIPIVMVGFDFKKKDLYVPVCCLNSNRSEFVEPSMFVGADGDHVIALSNCNFNLIP